MIQFTRCGAYPTTSPAMRHMHVAFRHRFRCPWISTIAIHPNIYTVQPCQTGLASIFSAQRFDGFNMISSKGFAVSKKLVLKSLAALMLATPLLASAESQLTVGAGTAAAWMP